MKEEQIDLEGQIERCRRLKGLLIDEEMRDALEELAEACEARLRPPKGERGERFMLSERN